MLADDVCEADNLEWLALMQSYSVLNMDFRLRFDALYRELSALRKLEVAVANNYRGMYCDHAAIMRDALDDVNAARHHQ